MSQIFTLTRAIGLTLAGLALLISSASGERIVTLGGPVTEIVYALGAGPAVVAVDQSSEFPAEAAEVPRVGYVAAVSAEGVLSMSPTLVLTTNRLGPPAAVDQLRASGIPMEIIPNPSDTASLREAIVAIGRVLQREEEAEALWARIETDLQTTRGMVVEEKAPRVAFLLGNNGIPMAAGSQTQADGIIHLAGGKNLFSEYTSYKPVSEEAILDAAPDFILIGTHQAEPGADPRERLQRLGLVNLAQSPGLQVRLLDLSRFLTFGPRTGEAARELAQILHGNPGVTPEPKPAQP